VSGAPQGPRPRPWNNPRIRAVLIQGAVLATVLGVAAFLIHNTLHNLEQRGIASGFGFLSSEAGFGIIQTLVSYDESSSYGRAFLVGLLNTLLVSGLGIVLASLLGLLIGIGRLSRNWLVARLAGAYVEVFRNIPLLLQLFFWYFAVLRALPPPRQSLTLGQVVFLNIRGLYLPRPVPQPGFGWVLVAAGVALVGAVLLCHWARRRQRRVGRLVVGLVAGLPLATGLLTGLPLSWEYARLQGFNFSGGLVLIPELIALVLALSIYTAAFIAEIVRAGIESVSRGQTEAAYALGLSPGQTLRLVVIPQAMRLMVPPLTNQYLNLTKNSSLAPAIAYPDLVSVFAGTVLNQTGQAIEVIGITMAVYLCISLAIALLMGWYSRRTTLAER
jgi:general L-amino acid transport system permease protein